MFPILLAELRPLFFRHGLRSDKDESFKAVFDVLTPHANSLIIRFLDRVKLLEARHLVEARIAMKSSSLHAYAQKVTSRIEQNYIREHRRISGEVFPLIFPLAYFPMLM